MRYPLDVIHQYYSFLRKGKPKSRYSRYSRTGDRPPHKGWKSE
ncbi:Uncharacterised protein [Vibrio cholerae]|nr:Uncharacterised protein [Vibrio cholerae]CSI70146.1 Uncharacterised protein [Vibrio cholerae]